MAVNIPHFDLPFRFRPDGHPAVVEQDTLDDIAVCAEAVIRTTKGQRVELPGFGIDDPVFRQNGANVPGVREAVETWEPRAESAIEEEWDFDEFTQNIRLTVRESLSDG